VLVVGLPLLAWRLGGRRFWGRSRPGAESDPWRDRMRRFGLTPVEAAQVESGMTGGAELRDDRLRRAAVTLAKEEIERRRVRSRSARRALAVVLWPSGSWSPSPR
jgi:hypothetical protein